MLLDIDIPEVPLPDEPSAGEKAAASKVLVPVRKLLVAEGVPLADEGRFVLDQVGLDKYMITDLLTCEQVNLHGIGWKLEFHSTSGRAFVFQEDQFDPAIPPTPVADGFAVDSRMRYDALQTSNGLIFIADKPTDGSKSRQINNELRVTKYKPISMSIRLGCANSFIELHCARFDVPRSGKQRVFVNLLDLYGVLRLEQYKGVPSAWVWRHKATSWKNFHDVAFGVDWFCDSNRNKEGAFKFRCLPFSGATFATLLSLLARGAFAAHIRGGFKLDSNVSASLEILNALVKNVGNPCTFTWFFDFVTPECFLSGQ